MSKNLHLVVPLACALALLAACGKEAAPAASAPAPYVAAVPVAPVPQKSTPAGEEVVAPEVQEPPKVVDLMEALRRSLNTVSADKKKPAKMEAAKPAKAKAVANGKKRKAS